MRFKAVIFDFDGVILDSEGFHYKAWKEVLEPYLDLEEDIYAEYKSMGRKMILEKVLEAYKVTLDEETKKNIRDNKAVVYARITKDFNESNMVKGIKNFLSDLQGKVKVGLATSSLVSQSYLDKFDLDKYFDVKTDGTLKAPLKPNPDIYVITAKKLNVDPKDCLVFEDSKVGAKAAKNAGMYCIGIKDKKHLNGIADEVIEYYYDDLINRI